MRVNDIQASRRRRRRAVTTGSQHNLTVAPNLLGQDFSAQAPDEKWVSDIPYVLTREGLLYLAAILDLFCRKVVGWSLDQTMPAWLATHALRLALQSRQPHSQFLHHSDRGGQ